ncbi:MAG: Flp pilus assembly protein CpaB [Heliobacteriaceae bacterium]|nr:Flp pilus assembly protein CpaB [Heliobacteriaceae bacterium]MDD4588306.1 Flp pilus assembly protein CpaB [Heliobacteriaceae bacterium]
MGKKIVVVALVLALATAFAVYKFIKDVEREALSRRLAPVVVAVKDIPAKTQLTRDLLKVEELPAESVHPQAARKLEDVLETVAKFPLVQGEQVLLPRTAKGRTGTAGLALDVPKGKRAIAVTVDEVRSVGFQIKQGDRVDVLLHVPLKVSDSAGEEVDVPIVATILENMEVLAIGRVLEPAQVEPAKPKGEENKPAENNEGRQAATVTLAADPDQVQALMLASEKGSIRFALRSPLDNKDVGPKVAPVDIKTLVERFGAGRELLEQLRQQADWESELARQEKFRQLEQENEMKLQMESRLRGLRGETVNGNYGAGGERWSVFGGGG